MAARGDGDRAAFHRAAGTIGADEAVASSLELAAENYRSRSGHLPAARALAQSALLSSTTTDRARRLLMAADSARLAGEATWARELALEAREASTDPLQHARSELLQGHLEARQGSTEAALRRFQRVAEKMSDEDPDLAAVAHGYASSAAIVVGDLAAAQDAALRAHEIAAHRPSRETLMSARETLGFVMALRGESAQAHRLLGEVVGWYERQPDRAGAEYPAEALIWLGEHQRVRKLLDDLVADARRLGAPSLLIQALVLRADLGYRTGEWPSAVADTSDAVNLSEDTGQSVPLAYALAMLSILEAFSGADDQARCDAERAREGARRHGLSVVDESACFALGALDLARGNPEATLARLEPVAAAVAASGRGEPAVVLWPAELIEALIAVDRRADAIDALTTLDVQARRDQRCLGTGRCCALPRRTCD